MAKQNEAETIEPPTETDSGSPQPRIRHAGWFVEVYPGYYLRTHPHKDGSAPGMSVTVYDNNATYFRSESLASEALRNWLSLPDVQRRQLFREC